VKSEPSTYSFERLVAEGRTRWDGVRNPTARQNLRAMKTGDLALFYHSGEGKAVVGIARVATEAYSDPTSGDGKWLAVDVEPVKALPRPVALAEIKAHPALAGLALVRQPRLSVGPVAKDARSSLSRRGNAEAWEVGERRVSSRCRCSTRTT
jgi:predicted RNA-binding protein with PUA-like domain